MADPYADFSTPVAPQSGADPYAAFSTPTAAPKTVGAAMSVNNPPLEPGGQSVGNTLLNGAKEVGKFYADSYKNAPASAGRLIANTYNAIADLPGTAKSVGALAAGLISKSGRPGDWKPVEGAYNDQPVLTPEQLAARNALEAPVEQAGKALAERYGGIPQIINTMRTDPIGMAADVSVLGGGGSLLPGRVGRLAGDVNRAIEPATATGNAVKGLALNVAEPVAANALGATTGATARDVRTAGRAGLEGNKAFAPQMRGTADMAAPVDMSKNAIAQMGAERGAHYRSGMVDISKDRTVGDFDAINKAVDSASEVGSFKGANMNPAASEINAALKSVVNDWETLNPKSKLFENVDPALLTPENFHTPEGLDALKRTVGNLRDATDRGTPARTAADRVYNAVKAEIEKQVPVYSEVMGDYAKASNEMKDLTKTFSLGDKASTDTALKKLQSTSRNNVQTSYTNRTKLLDKLAEFEPDLPYALAGQNMNALAPRGLVAKLIGGGSGLMAAPHILTNPALALAAPLFSPRVVGETAYAGGQALRKANEAANALRLAPNLRLSNQAAFQAGRYNSLRND